MDYKGQNNKKPNEYYVTEENESLWITGLPLKTEFGKIRPIKIKEYAPLSAHIEFLKLQGWEVKEMILKSIKGSLVENVIAESINNNDFMTCVQNNVFKLRDQYSLIFNSLIEDFDEKMFWKINNSEFDKIRKLILRYNGVRFYERNPNPEIEKFNMYERLIAKKNGASVEFDSIFALLMTKEGGGHKPHDINDFSILQFYSAFSSIQNVKNHDATIVFKAVDPKIEITNYFQSLREKEEDKVYKSLNELSKSNPFLDKR